MASKTGGNAQRYSPSNTVANYSFFNHSLRESLKEKIHKLINKLINTIGKPTKTTKR